MEESHRNCPRQPSETLTFPPSDSWKYWRERLTQNRPLDFPLERSQKPRGVRCHMRRTGDSLRPLSALLLALLFFPGCNAINPLCGSARPVPVIGSLSATMIPFAEVQQGFVLTVNGSQFVSSSVVVINGTTLSTTVVSSQQSVVSGKSPITQLVRIFDSFEKRVVERESLIYGHFLE